MNVVPFRLIGIAVLAAAAVTLAGCGRKGPLDPPSAALSQEDPNARPGLGESDSPGVFPGESTRKRAAPAQKPPPKDFFLDWLIR